MRTFCCCIPVRLGVLLLSPVTAVAAALLAYTQLFLLIHYQAQYDTFEKAICGALAGITILIALASLFGLLGSILARRSMVAFYSNMLWLGLLIFVVLGGIEIWQLFSHKEAFARSCENRTDRKTENLQNLFGVSLQGQTDEACRKVADVSAIAVTILFGILVLILLFLVNIVSKYKHQLAERDAAYDSSYPSAGRSGRSRVFGNIGTSSRRNDYQPAQMREVDEGGATLLHTTQPPAGFRDGSHGHASDPYQV